MDSPLSSPPPLEYIDGYFEPILSACERVFAIPELVTTLASMLTTKQLIALMKTSRQMQTLCEPVLFHEVDLSCPQGLKRFESVDAVRALARNGRNVRTARLELVCMIYYYNGLVGNNSRRYSVEDDQDQDQDQDEPLVTSTTRLDLMAATTARMANSLSVKTQDTTTTAATPTTMPLPLPDCPLLKQVEFFPFAPMSNLTALFIKVFTQCEDSSRRRFFVNSAYNSATGMMRVCYIIEQSPHLVDLKLEDIVPELYHELQYLPMAIHGLTKLRRLDISVCLNRLVWPHFGSAIYYSLPPSIREVAFNLTDFEMDAMGPNPLVGYINPGNSRPWSIDDFVWKAIPPRRQEPLPEFTNFSIGALVSDTTAEVLSLFDHCPEIVQLVIPHIGKRVKVSEVAQYIVKSCPQLKILVCDGFQSKQINTLMAGIMQALPEQRLDEFTWAGYKDDPATDYRRLFQRHSRTLQKIDMSLCRGIKSKTIKTILCECYALEEFSLQPHHWTCETKLDLVDAVSAPWVCTRIRLLYLLIGIVDLRPASIGRAAVLKPYYKRKPFFLTMEEKEQFSQLEALYKQIGQLTQLSILVMKASMVRPTDPAPLMNPNVPADEEGIWFGYQNLSFPGMLSLGDPKTGRPGYLHHLKGLKNLRLLLGSVAVDTDETLVTVGWDEIRYIDKCWPRLQRAEMIQRHDVRDTNGEFWHKPIGWLMKKRPGLSVSMPGLPEVI
ncbi:hypothetical protein BGX33_004984 [Mortierella sp. NVP41]|nr:hypothetical protein BGX33_004984 [Mortierella sp. NVP41]